MLKKYNGHYYESEFEQVFIKFLEQVGWTYTFGKDVNRIKLTDVLIKDDFESFVAKTNPTLNSEEVKQIFDVIRLAGGETEFTTLHKLYKWYTHGLQFTPQNGLAIMIKLIDFDNPENNIFRVVNQFEVEYTNNGQKSLRIPDVILFVNGLPLCIIELKNPSKARATIHEAWEQIYIRYWRDIPHLLHYSPLACISDGVKSRLGTIRTPYEHFYAWRRVNDDEKIARTSFEETRTLINGVYSPDRFLEIFRDYIYFRDSIYDSDECEIVCRYPQFFAARLLRESIKKSVSGKTGKGGTYFGATGCGKTYTMAFLARQLALRCTDIPEMGSPTIILIVDRNELQKQGAKLFTKSTEFLNLGEVKVVESRAELRRELGLRNSGGFYICTIQKFCDREDDKIGLINKRNNIICFSDEAHRSQIEKSRKIQFSKDADENMRVMISKPYAKVLKEALPGATFVGFTGTPIAETYQTFGDEIDRYTMDQAVADGLTVPIKYHPRIAKVLLDENKVKQIESYYEKCAEEGATKEDIEASKRAMSSMEIILGEDSRLERLAKDIYEHYTSSCENNPDRIQKAMVVCSNREIAFNLLKKFEQVYPTWFEKKKVPEGIEVTSEELKKIKPMPTIAIVASVGKIDREEMYNYLGGGKNDSLDIIFKHDKSNFRVVIVVNMWITGFDVPTLTYLYNDKPLKKHLLIQTISRVNRKYPDKEYGLIIDYIGIRKNMREALKTYGGDTSIAPTKDDVYQAKGAFIEELEILKRLFSNYDLSPFISAEYNPIERYTLLASAAEYVFSSLEKLNIESSGKIRGVLFKTYFLKTVKRMKAAYDICQPSGELNEKDMALVRCFMAIAGFVRKMSGTSDIDADSMNRDVSKMIEEVLKYNEVESILENVEEEVGEIQELTSQDIITMPTKQALEILEKMKKSRESFRKLGLTFEEKAFYDILIAMRDKYNFDYGKDVVIEGVVINEKCKELSKKIKEEIDTKSSFADWLNNQNVRNELQLSIKICLAKNGYPPKYDNEVFNKVMEQVENFSEHSLRNNKILKEKKEVREVAEDKLKYSEDIVD